MFVPVWSSWVLLICFRLVGSSEECDMVCQTKLLNLSWFSFCKYSFTKRLAFGNCLQDPELDGQLTKLMLGSLHSKHSHSNGFYCISGCAKIGKRADRWKRVEVGRGRSACRQSPRPLSLPSFRTARINLNSVFGVGEMSSAILQT